MDGRNVYTSEYWELVFNSPAIRRDLEAGIPQPKVIPAQRTDWAKDSPTEVQRELYGEYDPDSPTCPTCYMLRSANGACECRPAARAGATTPSTPGRCEDCKRYGIAPCPH